MFLSEDERMAWLQRSIKRLENELSYLKELELKFGNENCEHSFDITVIDFFSNINGSGKVKQCVLCGDLAEFSYAGKFHKLLTKEAVDNI